jgi:transcriptional regulator with XRE-family HTH domain
MRSLAAHGTRIGVALGAELRDARRAHGLSQAAVARALGMQQTRVSRIERGTAPHATLAELNAVAAALGLRLFVRCYPVGSPLRDAAQVALLEELRSRIHRTWRWRTEVPVPLPGDLRAADAVIAAGSCVVVIEAWTRLTDLQAQTRAAQLKRRDFGDVRLVLLVADTRLNRSALRAAGGSLRAEFPLRTRAVAAALAAGRDPGADGIVMLRARRRRPSAASPPRARTARDG